MKQRNDINRCFECKVPFKSMSSPIAYEGTIGVNGRTMLSNKTEIIVIPLIKRPPVTVSFNRFHIPRVTSF